VRCLSLGQPQLVTLWYSLLRSWSRSLAVGAGLAHLSSSAHHFVHQEELLAENGSDVEELLFDDVVVPDVGLTGGQRLTSQNIHSEGFSFLDVGLLDLDKGVLGVETRVLGQSAGNAKKGLSENENTELHLSGNFLGALVLGQMLASSDLEGATTGDNSLVEDGVGDSSKTITDGILGLGDGVIVGSLDEDGDREGVLDALNESVLVVTERLLVNKLGEAEVRLKHVVDGVELLATAGEGDTLTVSSLCAADTHDAVAGEDLEGGGVNTLLVDDNEVLVGAVTEALLELDDLHDSVVSELSLGLDELLSLIGVGPEEAGVDLGLLVLEGDVEAHDVTVLEAGWHVVLATTVIEDETANKAGLGGHLVLHVHDLDHVEVDAIIAGELLLGDFEGVQEAEALSLGHLDTINDDTGVDSLTDVALSLAHKLANEKDVGGGTVADDIVLGGGSAANHGGGRVLDLHLVQENAAVLGQLDLSGASDKPII
jgi:hypothetical protein